MGYVEWYRDGDMVEASVRAVKSMGRRLLGERAA